MRIRIMAVSGLILVLGLSMPGWAAELRAGAGKAEIAVADGMPLSGYGNRINQPNTGVHDKVYARALVLESGGQRAGLVNADVLLITRELRDDLARRVADLDLDFLAVTATHTHYSIGAYVDNRVAEIAVMGKYDPKAYEIVVSSMEQALRLAASAITPAKAGAAIIPSPAVSKNRRHPGGPTDPDFRVLGVWSADGKLLAAIMNHAIHPTTMPSTSTLVSGDVTGAAELALESNHPGAVAMFMNAGLGDQSPDAGDDVRGWDEVNEIGSAMSAAADQALAAASPSGDVTLSLYTREFDMPKAEMRLAWECWGGLNQLFPALGGGMMRTRGEVMGLGLNDALLLFSPGELAYEVQTAIAGDFPEKKVLVVVHSNDLYGYVVTAEDYATGGYETCMNFYGPGFAAVLEDEFKSMVLRP